jgi:hypothetical protein
VWRLAIQEPTRDIFPVRNPAKQALACNKLLLAKQACCLRAGTARLPTPASSEPEKRSLSYGTGTGEGARHPFAQGNGMRQTGSWLSLDVAILQAMELHSFPTVFAL